MTNQKYDQSDYPNLPLAELIRERHNIKNEYADVRYSLDESSARYHEDGVQGDRYAYADLNRDKRILENDIELLNELISFRKNERDSKKDDSVEEG